VSISTSEKRNTICIWTTLTGEWSDAYLHAFTLGGLEKAAAACFAPVDTQSSYSLVTSGRNYVSFWSDEQSNLVLSHRLINENVVSIAALNETIVTGTSAGLLLVWRDKDIVDKIHAHNRAVLQLITCPEGLVSASEGIVTLWSRALQRIASYEVATTQTICSLDICTNKSREATMKILVGTESTIYEISVVTGRVTVALIKYIE
jgi:WD40 repeat protein